MTQALAFPVINGRAQYAQYLQLAKIAVHMQRTGWRISKPRAEAHRDAAVIRAKALKDEIITLTGLDPGDSGLGPQWVTYFLKTLGLPPVSFDKHTRRPQLNAAALLTYANDWEDPDVKAQARALYLYRKNTKLLNAFLYPLLENPGDRIHPAFNVAGTKGARWSASKPNIQQISRDVTEGKSVLIPSFKDVFIADEGCVLIKADYSALELRLIAYVTASARLIDWIDRGVDPHIENALALFGLPRLASEAEMQRQYKAERTAAKPCMYGLSYNRSDNVDQLWKQLKQIPQFKNITVAEVKKLRSLFFKTQPEILAWQDRTQRQIEDCGYIEAPVLLRRLYLQKNTRGYNMGNNFQMQTTGGDLINRAIIDLYPLLNWESGEQIRAQVHDELVLQAPQDKALEVANKIEECMGAPIQFGEVTARFPAETSIGYDWKNTVKKEEWAA